MNEEIVNEDLEEDIPFQEDWNRISVVDMKQSICNWIDDNLEPSPK